MLTVNMFERGKLVSELRYKDTWKNPLFSWATGLKTTDFRLCLSEDYCLLNFQKKITLEILLFVIIYSI